jgi:hypothetical protein
MLASGPRFSLSTAVFFISLVAALSVSMAIPDAILSASFLSLACLVVPEIARARTALYLRLETPRDLKRKIPRHLRI